MTQSEVAPQVPTRLTSIPEATVSAPKPVDHLPPVAEDLDRSLVAGIAWTGGVKTAVQILSWLSTLVVARLLSPRDYGISGMAMVYVGFVQLVNEFGLSAAVVQRRDLTDDQVAKLGGLSVLLGAFLCAVSILLAPAVGWFFGQPAVRAVVIVLSTTFLTSAFQVLPRSLLTRELRFRNLAMIEATEAVTTTVFSLTLAIQGFGYWALVVGATAGRIASTIVALRYRHHRLSWPAPLSSISELVFFGSNIAVSNIAWYVFRNADMTVVGRRIGEKALGAYTLGWNVASLPVDRVSSLIARATPAIFARVQDDPRALQRYVLTLTEAISLIAVPAAVGLAVVASDFVAVVLGPAWQPAVLPLRLLALAAVFRSTIPILNQVLVATGQASLAMRSQIGIAIILPVLFVFGSARGLAGVAFIWLVGFPIVSYFLYVRKALATCELSPVRYFRAVQPALLTSAIMAIAVLGAERVLASSAPTARLVLCVVVGAAVYALAGYAMHRRRLTAFLSTARMLRSA